jgi:hypothetical protein
MCCGDSLPKYNDFSSRFEGSGQMWNGHLLETVDPIADDAVKRLTKQVEHLSKHYARAHEEKMTWKKSEKHFKKTIEGLHEVNVGMKNMFSKDSLSGRVKTERDVFEAWLEVSHPHLYDEP